MVADVAAICCKEPSPTRGNKEVLHKCAALSSIPLVMIIGFQGEILNQSIPLFNSPEECMNSLTGSGPLGPASCITQWALKAHKTTKYLHSAATLLYLVF